MKTLKSYTRSSSFFIATLSAFILLVVFSTLGIFLYLFSNIDFMQETKAALIADADHFERWHDEGGIQAVIDTIEARQSQSSEQIYLLIDRDGKKLAGTLNEWPQKITQKFGMKKIEIPHADIDLPLKSTRTMGAQYDILAEILPLEDGHRLLVGRSIDDIEITQELVSELAWFSLAVLGLIVIVNFLISVYVVNRVNRIAAIAREVMETGDLTTRINISGGWDDLSYLARIINSMMDYIDRLVENIKQVSDNIAHDLRSPLTRLQNRIDSLVENKPITAAEKQSLKKDSETLLSMFSALLRISEIEAGKHVFQKKEVHITTLMEDVVEFLEPVAQEKNIEIHPHIDDCTFPIDRDLLFQAVLNVMENAVKFTPQDGHIEVRAKQPAHDHLEIIIADSGPGISDTDKSKVFQRFYRADESRNTPGHGLGLSMVKAIIDHHNGSIVLEDNQPGLRVIMTLSSTIA